MFAALTAAGTTSSRSPFGVTRIMPLARPLGGRITLLNARIREAAGRHGVTVAEMNHHAVATDCGCGARPAARQPTGTRTHRRRHGVHPRSAGQRRHLGQARHAPAPSLPGLPWGGLVELRWARELPRPVARQAAAGPVVRRRTLREAPGTRPGPGLVGRCGWPGARVCPKVRRKTSMNVLADDQPH